jgi:hypothetical protein
VRQVMREIISRLFNRSGNSADVRYLTRLVRRFAIEQQQVPKDLDDLVRLKYLTSVPTAPLGQRFVIDRKKAAVRMERDGT